MSKVWWQRQDRLLIHTLDTSLDVLACRPVAWGGCAFASKADSSGGREAPAIGRGRSKLGCMQRSRQVCPPRPLALRGAAGLLKRLFHRLLESAHLVILRVFPLVHYQTAVHEVPVLVGSSERLSGSHASGPAFQSINNKHP